MKSKSKRFVPSGWSERLVPILLGLLALALLAIVVIVALAAFGLLPG